MGARAFFDSVLEASQDADRCRSTIAAMEQRALSLGGTALGGRVSASRTADAMGNRVAALVDREAKLHARIESDYAMLDMASRILYGDDLHGGLASIAPSWWADVLALHYCDGLPMRQVAEVLGYSERHCFNASRAAFDVLDAHGLVASVAGHGFAES